MINNVPLTIEWNQALYVTKNLESANLAIQVCPKHKKELTPYCNTNYKILEEKELKKKSKLLKT